MNRLAPLIARRSAAFAAPLSLEGQDDRDSDLVADLKLLATGWLGGLVVFGTFLA